VPVLSRIFSDRPSRPRPGFVPALATLGAVVALAGCGSSGNSNSIGVGVENTNAAAEAAKQAGATTASTPTTATTAATTPTSGPLASEPHITLPKGPAPTHLVITEIVKGTGAVAKVGQTITVNYVGALYNSGKIFDASWKRHEPASFPLEQGQLIAGWVQGIPGMRVGGRRELIIPASLAYGAAGRPPTIPPNAPLIFVIDLLGV